MEKEINKVDVEEITKEKEFFIGVTDYSDGQMFAIIEDKKSDYIMSRDRVFRIVIPANK
jgi:hypothetical protein